MHPLFKMGIPPLQSSPHSGLSKKPILLCMACLPIRGLTPYSVHQAEDLSGKYLLSF